MGKGSSKRRLRRIRNRQDTGKKQSQIADFDKSTGRPWQKSDQGDNQKNVQSPDYAKAPVQKEYIDRGNKFLNFYDLNYKKLLFIPFIMLLLAFGQILYQDATTGDFMNKGVSLKGGVTITIPVEGSIDVLGLENFLLAKHPEYDITARAVTSLGTVEAVLIEADAATKEESEQLLASISEYTETEQGDISVDLIGSSLGESFFRQTFIAMLIAFFFMGCVVFIYFRTLAPSLAVILAAFSDIVITLSIVNLLGIKISTAGIAAFLMLIGYSIDTDILLSTRVLKRKDEGDVFSRVLSAAKTGLTMNFTTMAALVVGILLSQSAILTQIMTILLIGLLVDIINTWIQNVGILRIYLERKGEE